MQSEVYMESQASGEAYFCALSSFIVVQICTCCFFGQSYVIITSKPNGERLDLVYF